MIIDPLSFGDDGIDETVAEMGSSDDVSHRVLVKPVHSGKSDGNRLTKLSEARRKNCSAIEDVLSIGKHTQPDGACG